MKLTSPWVIEAPHRGPRYQNSKIFNLPVPKPPKITQFMMVLTTQDRFDFNLPHHQSKFYYNPVLISVYHPPKVDTFQFTKGTQGRFDFNLPQLPKGRSDFNLHQLPKVGLISIYPITQGRNISIYQGSDHNF